MGLQDENRESFDDALARANELERKKKENTQSPLDLAAIDGMDAEELRNIIRTVLQAGYGIKGISIAELTNNAIKQDDALYEALMLKGITLALNASEWREFHALASFWAERKKGKPSQAIDVTGKIGIVDLVLEAGRRRNLQLAGDSLLLSSVDNSKIIDNQ